MGNAVSMKYVCSPPTETNLKRRLLNLTAVFVTSTLSVIDGHIADLDDDNLPRRYSG
jgi:hypothetical protein